MTKGNYEDLKVWQEAVNLVDKIYKVTKKYPKEEIFCLVSQMRRAAISVPSNIAEGSERKGKKEFLHFLYISEGSLAELKTQLIISFRNGLISKDEYDDTMNNFQLVSRMLAGLIKSMQKTEN